MRVRRSRCALVAALGTLACGAEPRPTGTPAPPARQAPPDSLVATTSAGAQVWLVPGRQGTAADGRTCDERLIEVRRDTARVRVPLLYTGDVPRLLNDSTLEATLWLHCVAGDRYHVNLRTGQPVKQRAGGGT